MLRIGPTENAASSSYLPTVAFLPAVLLVMGWVVVEDGEVGVSKSFGSISDEPVMQSVPLHCL